MPNMPVEQNAITPFVRPT